MLWTLIPAALWGGVLFRYDCRERRLPNWLTLGGAAVALAWRYGYGGSLFLVDGFVAATLGGLFLFVPYLMRGAGGGDVKMLAGAGAIVGTGGLLTLLLATSLAGVVFGVAMLAAGKLDGARLKHLGRCLFDWRYDRQAGKAGLPPKDSERTRIPFSLPIALGTLAALAL